MSKPNSLSLCAVLTACSVLGCRTVWVHPDASEAKWHQDYDRCRYGLTSKELEQHDADPYLALPPRRDDWKQCLLRLGWRTRSGRHGSAPYSTE